MDDQVRQVDRDATALQLAEIVRRLVAGFSPQRIILFGSHARGTAGPDSDIDLMVVKTLSGPRRQERLEMRMALRGVGIAKDLIVVTPEEVERWGEFEGTLIADALSGGRLLYARPD